MDNDPIGDEPMSTTHLTQGGISQNVKKPTKTQTPSPKKASASESEATQKGTSPKPKPMSATGPSAARASPITFEEFLKGPFIPHISGFTSTESASRNYEEPTGPSAARASPINFEEEFLKGPFIPPIPGLTSTESASRNYEEPTASAKMPDFLDAEDDFGEITNPWIFSTTEEEWRANNCLDEMDFRLGTKKYCRSLDENCKCKECTYNRKKSLRLNEGIVKKEKYF